MYKEGRLWPILCGKDMFLALDLYLTLSNIPFHYLRYQKSGHLGTKTGLSGLP